MRSMLIREPPFERAKLPELNSDIDRLIASPREPRFLVSYREFSAFSGPETHLVTRTASLQLCWRPDRRDASWSPTAKEFALATESARGCGNAPRTGTVQVCDREGKRLSKRDFLAHSVAFSPRGNTLLCCGSDKIWRVTKPWPHRFASIPTGSGTLRWAQFLEADYAIAHDDQKVFLLRVADLKCVASCTPLQVPKYLMRGSKSPARNFFVFGFDSTEPFIHSAALASDRKLLVIAGSRDVSTYRIVRQ